MPTEYNNRKTKCWLQLTGRGPDFTIERKLRTRFSKVEEALKELVKYGERVNDVSGVLLQAGFREEEK